MDQDHLLGCNQHGFRKHHSTDTALATLISQVSQIRDRGNLAAVYSVDLTAAFDVLRKESLIEVLIRKQVPSYLIRSIHEYLCERSGYVQIDKAISCVRDIRAGCIQGSVLGPVLFNIYMSELNEVIYPETIISYADDSYVVVEGSSKEEIINRLQASIKRHFEWLKRMGMICNMNKTELITFGIENLEIKIMDDTITSGKQLKVLGSIVDHKLSWEPNITKIIGKCRSLAFSLRYLRRHLTLEETVKIFKAHVSSRITFGAPIWGHALSFSLRSKLRSVYFYIIRLIVRDFNFNLNRTSLLRKAKLDNIDDLFFKRASCFIFGLTFHLEPTELVGVLISKTYVNDRLPNRLVFFDTSRSRVGRACITNAAKHYSENWQFDWVGLTFANFKEILNSQLTRAL